MYAQFYNYLVKTLLRNYLKRVCNKPGDRYYVIIDDKAAGDVNPRELFINSLNEISEELVVKGVYAAGHQGVEEEPYATRVIKLGDSCAPVIVGFDHNATEDYLVTMRNAVTDATGKYAETYSALFVLSERPQDSSNPLSSICSTCTDLKSPGQPFSVDYVVNDIRGKEKSAFGHDHERLYFDVYLNKVTSRIGDGSSSLYDLMPALSAISKGTINGLFNELCYFPDDIVFDPKNTLKDKEITDRAEMNFGIYSQVDEIMSREDDVDKVELLTHILDEKLSKKIGNAKDESWRQIDFQDILDSIGRKRGSDDLKLISIELKEAGLLSALKKDGVYKRKYKKTTTYALVCDRSNSGLMHVKMVFNKSVKQGQLNGDRELTASSSKVYVEAPTTFTSRHRIGKDDNTHDVFALSVPCSTDFFDDIKEGELSISQAGEAVLTVPFDRGEIVFGSGDVVEQLGDGVVRQYDEHTTYKLPIDAAQEEDYEVNFKFNFGATNLAVVVRVKADKTGEVDPIKNPDKRDQYCKWEDAFIEKRATTLVVTRNDLTQSCSTDAESYKLDAPVEQALNGIYAYYANKKAGPSLLPFTEEVKKLFKLYLDAVVASLSSIQNGVSLANNKYNITKLGVVEFDGKVYFSPFNPLMVAYALEYDRQKDVTEEDYTASELLSPFYLAPFIQYDNNYLRPCWEPGLSRYKNWLCYEMATSRPQDRAQDITTRMVCSKIQEFIKHFKYLFQDKDCPIKISTIGIEDDRNVIKGILKYILREYKDGVQRIELHEYVSNLMVETYFEKLNRLVSVDMIVRDLDTLGVKIEKKGEYTSQEIIHQLFSRVVLYKHPLENEVGYSHIAFYQMDTGSTFIRYPMSKLRGELAFNGLVSIPSTLNEDRRYYLGFGMGGINESVSDLHNTARLINNLYANEAHAGINAFQNEVGIVKMHEFGRGGLLNSIYKNANWVTFLNPEVDIDFFYKQDLYIVHYTDQYSINAKYDSITVTRQIDQYANMIRRLYERYHLSESKFATFNCVMSKYFNCLNGNWLLSMVNKTEAQINEKMSLVAASKVMQRFMQRNVGIIWIPVSLEEILRVTGSINLPRHYIFTKEDIGATGAMSDDLLMMGLDASDPSDIRLYLYPIEVKLSKSSSFSDKGGEQVSNTYQSIRDNLLGDDNFTKKIFRTFFASQYLVNAEKLHANGLMQQGDYDIIDSCRYRLLNLKYKLCSELPVREMGNAALVSFYSQTPHSMRTSIVNGVAVCEIHFSEKECFEFVADSDSPDAMFLTRDPIEYDDAPSSATSVASQEGTAAEAAVDPGLTEDSSEAEVNEVESISNENADDPASVAPDQSATVEESSEPIQAGMRIILGTASGTSRVIEFEPNNTRIVSHPNMGIIGTMGTGKTQFARSVIAQLAEQSSCNVDARPVGVLIFDYKGDYKDKDFLDASGGVCYKSNFPFNPLKLIRTPDLDGVNLPAVTADRISDSFAKAYGLGLRQQGNIKQVIIETYADFGITRDPSTWDNPIPTMDNVIEKYFATFDAGDKAYVLFDKLRDYTIFTADNNACVSIFEWLDKVRVIDLTLYPDDTKKVIVSLILDLFYAEMRQLGGSKQVDGYRQIRSFIMVDEAHQFLKKDFNSLRSIISEGRMFGVGMILSTQNLSDFKSANEDYSQFILSWVIHHVNSISKAEIASIFGATDTNAERYMDRINKAKLFESVCKIGGDVSAMRDLPFFEYVKKEHV